MGTVKERQLQKMKTHPGFIAALDQSGGSTPNALRAYGIKENAWSNEEEMFAIVHQMRTRIMTSPCFTGERINGTTRFTFHRGLSLECETGGAVSESGQGPGRREKRRPVDEADARASCAARQGQSEADIRNQDALVRQASQRSGHQGRRDPAVRNSSADHRRGPRADRRAGSGYSLPGQSQGRRVAQGGHPRGAQQTAGGSAGHAQAHLAGGKRPVRRIRQTSQGREGGCVVGRLYKGRRQRALAEESRRRGQLFAGAGRGADGPAIRCRVQRPVGCIDSEHLRGVQHLSEADKGTMKLAPSILVAGSAIFGDREGVAAAMNRLRTALNDRERETEPAERSALQRSQLCSSE